MIGALGQVELEQRRSEVRVRYDNAREVFEVCDSPSVQKMVTTPKVSVEVLVPTGQYCLKEFPWISGYLGEYLAQIEIIGSQKIQNINGILLRGLCGVQEARATWSKSLFEVVLLDKASQ